MSDYDSLASIYDEFTDGFNHEEYLELIFSFAPYLPKTGLALDCGCGTGTLISLLSKMGFSCTGVDISEDMLQCAKEKLEKEGFEAHLVCQELDKIDLYGAYDICFCSLDTLNHLTDVRKMRKFIKKLYNFTEPNGYFIFDVKTEKLFEKSNSVQVYEKNGALTVIDGRFSSGKMTNIVTCFVENNGLYKRNDAEIEERFYSRDELKNTLKTAGYTNIKIKTALGREIYICKKRGTAIT